MGIMQNSPIQALINLNDRFYTDCGASFAATRKRVLPGVLRGLEHWVKPGDWLDLGCGSGALAGIWVERGIQGLYEGLDFSPILIAEAQANIGQLALAEGQKVRYFRANLGAPDWLHQCSLNQYDGILMFAAMHHLPGHETHLRLICQVAELLAPGGLFIHSEWQFQNSPKLMSRIKPWSLAGIDPTELEEGDTLLDWRHAAAGQEENQGLRYVHLFSRQELEQLAGDAGFNIEQEFVSDGAGERLGLYQLWLKC
jgi:SAM-dependent methyltransferase